VWRGGPVFLGNLGKWQLFVLHRGNHTENAVDVKVWRPPERLHKKHTALQWYFRAHFVEQLCRTFSNPLVSGANG
jgi:hypothetical protein